VVQTCSERQYPPSDVAQMLDSAVTSLQPYSSQNLIIYKEIQQSIGVIKNQILAFILTHTSIYVSIEISTMPRKCNSPFHSYLMNDAYIIAEKYYAPIGSGLSLKK